MIMKTGEEMLITVLFAFGVLFPILYRVFLGIEAAARKEVKRDETLSPKVHRLGIG